MVRPRRRRSKRSRRLCARPPWCISGRRGLSQRSAGTPKCHAYFLSPLQIQARFAVCRLRPDCTGCAALDIDEADESIIDSRTNGLSSRFLDVDAVTKDCVCGAAGDGAEPDRPPYARGGSRLRRPSRPNCGDVACDRGRAMPDRRHRTMRHRGGVRRDGSLDA